MLPLLKKLWNWIRSLFRKKPPISGDRENEPQPEPTDLEYENTLMALLEQVDQGKTWPQLLVFLMGKKISKDKLAKWLKGKGELWLQTPANYQELGRSLGMLAAVATGDLGNNAKYLSNSLLVSEDDPTPDDPVQALIDLYVQQYKNGDYQGAYDTAYQITQQYPDDYRGWLYLGFLMGDFQKYEEALVSFDQALKIQPDHYLVWENRGWMLLQLGRYEEALVSYEQTLIFKPDYYKAWENRGWMLLQLGRYEEALVSYEQTLKIQPDDHIAWENRGAILSNCFNKYEEALDSYNQALKIKSCGYEAWANRGIKAYQSSYNSYYQDQFVTLFQTEINNAAETTLQSFENPTKELETFIRQPLSETVIQQLHQDTLLHPYRLNPTLNLRGYEGELASLQAELDKAIRKDTHPKGWGRLHHYIGKAHYDQAKITPLPPYLREGSPHNRGVTGDKTLYHQAETHYHQALETLTPDKFPEYHLEVIQDLIKVKLALGKYTEAEDIQLQGLEVLKKLLNQTPSRGKQRQLEAKFNSFRQLRVHILIQKGEPIAALTSAELEKNRCLTHILDAWGTSILSPSYEEIQTLLNPSQGIIYWHLSPYALTTFIIKPNQPEPIVIDNTDTSKLKEWTQDWEKDYQDYKSKQKTPDPAHPWRVKMCDRLNRLKQILDISSIEAHLEDIQQLILIPHHDLHRLPLHSLFKKGMISYLPSTQIGLAIGLKPNNEPNNGAIGLKPNNERNNELKLLSVENPANDLQFTEIESAVINSMFADKIHLEGGEVTEERVINELKQPYHLFHFTGHGYYNSQEPENSALILGDKQQITAKTIRDLNLDSYQLICLAACETALTGRKTLEMEYVGLVSAFLKAGAACVISTLWTVDELSSAWVMIHFYQQYCEGINPIIALANSQNWLKNLTPNQLIAWLTELKYNVSVGVANLIQDQINKITQDPDKVNYTDPYYWAGFTINSIY